MRAMASRSWLTARMAVPVKVRVRNRYSPIMARIASTKAMSRVKEMKIPPISMVGSVTRTDRWSVLHRNVAKDWMKKRSPPVARSWLIGGLARIGEMMSRCTARPRSAPRPSEANPASPEGQP